MCNKYDERGTTTTPSSLKPLYWIVAGIGLLLLLLMGRVFLVFNMPQKANTQAISTAAAYATTLTEENKATFALVTAEAPQMAWQAEQTATAQSQVVATLQPQQTASASAIETLQVPQMVTAQVAFQKAQQTAIAQATAEAVAALPSEPTIIETIPSAATPSAVETILPTQSTILPAETMTPFAVEAPAVEATPSVAEGDQGPASNAPIEGSLVDRMTNTAQNAPANSPYNNTTWVTYYGRPNIAVMGILGEYGVNELIPRLRQQANVYDEANGPELGIMPALHLVYGMATKLPGEDNDHLAFLTDEVVMEYIQAAQRENMAVILDIQIGKLTPVEAIRHGLPYLQYGNVHLAIDPEFAMTEPDQGRPGNPIGFITAQQVNQVQAVMQEHMNANNIPGSRILLLHQFLEPMIVNKDQLQRYPKIDLTTTADGWGPPKGKIKKYNGFMTQNSFFTGFKLFYQWDKPVMTERQALGIDFGGEYKMQITPNLIIYQ